MLQLLRQRVYQVAAGYEDCNDANHLRVAPALRLALGKEQDSGAGQFALCRFENNILATGEGLNALEDVLRVGPSEVAGELNSPLHGPGESAKFPLSDWSIPLNAGWT